MIFHKPPPNFKPRFTVVSCFMESDGKILLLHRLVEKSQGGKWGLPAGKINGDEDLKTAMMREIAEETGVRLTPDALTYLRKVYVRYPTYDYPYHMFRTQLKERPTITINPHEHRAFQWTTPFDALPMPLMLDADACIKLVYEI